MSWVMNLDWILFSDLNAFLIRNHVWITTNMWLNWPAYSARWLTNFSRCSITWRYKPWETNTLFMPSSLNIWSMKNFVEQHAAPSTNERRPVPGGTTTHVQAVVKGTALLPCDLTAPVTNDTVVLIVWYKNQHTPIYRWAYLKILSRVTI